MTVRLRRLYPEIMSEQQIKSGTEQHDTLMLSRLRLFRNVGLKNPEILALLAKCHYRHLDKGDILLATDVVNYYVGVAVLVWRGDRLLLGERISAGEEPCWQFPGGHLEYAETVPDCARREVLEETGLEIEQLKLAAYSGDVFVSNARHYVTLFVSASSTRGEPRVMEADKCARWQWFSPDSLPAPLFAPITSLLSAHPDLKALT